MDRLQPPASRPRSTRNRLASRLASRSCCSMRWSSASGRWPALTSPASCWRAQSRARANRPSAPRWEPAAPACCSKPSSKAFCSVPSAASSDCCSANPPSNCSGIKSIAICRSPAPFIWTGGSLSGLAALTLLTAVLAGAFPALRAMRRDVQGSLHGVTTTASVSQNRTREALVVAQLALTLVFLVGAGLFLRTIHALRQVPLGFTQQNVLTGGIIVNAGGAIDRDEDAVDTKTNIVRDSYLPLLDRLRAIPGVKVAALSSVLPLRAEFAVRSRAISITRNFRGPNSVSRRPPGLGRSCGCAWNSHAPRSLLLLKTTRPPSPPVVVVNQAFVNKYLPGQDPDRPYLLMGKGPFRGYAHRRRHRRCEAEQGHRCHQAGNLFLPGADRARDASLRHRHGLHPGGHSRRGSRRLSLRAQFDKALHEVAPDATTTDVKTIHEAVEDSFGSQTLIAHLLESFAGLALLIASVGLYGLLSFAVAQRTREIGLRIALGAPQANISRLDSCAARFFWSLSAWLSAAFWPGLPSRFAAQLHLWSPGARWPHLHRGRSCSCRASLLAAWLPARRAAAVDPILALRSE